MQKEKYHLLANQYLQGKRTLKTSTRTEDRNTFSTRENHCILSDRPPKLPTRGQKTKIHAVLDENTVYSPTDDQSYQYADRRQKYMQYQTRTLYILRQTTKVTNTRTEDKSTCSTRRKYFILSDRQPKLPTLGPKAKYMQYQTKILYTLLQTTKVTNTRTEGKIHAILDENTFYSPTDNQSFLKSAVSRT